MPVSKSTGKTKKIYLDYASSVEPNPSSIHTLGIEARGRLEDSRKKIAEILNTQPKNIIFTSGGTESNNLAIQGTIASASQIFFSCALPGVPGGTLGVKKFGTRMLLPHIITTNIEHSSVLETCRALEKKGLAEITIVPVEANGVVDSKKIKKAIKKNTVLVSVMYANNEIGTIQPIKEIAKEIRHARKINSSDFPYFHADAVQAANYLDLNVDRLGIDSMTLSGSKIEHGGKVGALFIKKGISISPLMYGGSQELGLHPGTENVFEIGKFSKALMSAQKTKEKESARLLKLRNYFIYELENSHIFKNIGILINGDSEARLPNNVNITIPKIPSDLLVIELSARGVYVSEKSACKSGDKKSSYVIEAIRKAQGLEKRQDYTGSVRFSFGKSTGKKHLDYTLKCLEEILKKLGKWYD